MQTARILVVDDNPVNLKLIGDVLEAEGYRVQRASGAAVAREVLGRERPDLVLMDIQMPGMDGLQFTRELKSDARYRDLPVVAVTALAMKGDAQKALEAGLDGYITKPVNTRTLAQQLATLLGTRRCNASGDPP